MEKTQYKKDNKENVPPVTEGQTLENMKIEAIGSKGDGIAKVKGYTIIVLQSEINQTYNLRILRVMPKFAFAEII